MSSHEGEPSVSPQESEPYVTRTLRLPQKTANAIDTLSDITGQKTFKDSHKMPIEPLNGLFLNNLKGER